LKLWQRMTPNLPERKGIAKGTFGRGARSDSQSSGLGGRKGGPAQQRSPGNGRTGQCEEQSRRKRIKQKEKAAGGSSRAKNPKEWGQKKVGKKKKKARKSNRREENQTSQGESEATRKATKLRRGRVHPSKGRAKKKGVNEQGSQDSVLFGGLESGGEGQKRGGTGILSVEEIC